MRSAHLAAAYHTRVKYPDNIIEPDHRLIKKRTKPMLRLKSFRSTKITIAGIENIRTT